MKDKVSSSEILLQAKHADRKCSLTLADLSDSANTPSSGTAHALMQGLHTGAATLENGSAFS